MKKLILLMFMLGAVLGCGDAFRRGKFSQPNSTGYTTLTFGGAVTQRLSNFLDDISRYDGSMALQSFVVAPASHIALFATGVTPDGLTSAGNLVAPVRVKKISGTDATWVLPNGNWSFAFVGYDNPTMDSTLQCSLGTTNSDRTTGIGNAILLDGAPRTIYFQTAACGISDEFRGDNYGKVAVAICNSASDFTASMSTPGLDYITDGSAPAKLCTDIGGNAGATQFRIAYANTRDDGTIDYPLSAANAVMSDCTTTGTGGTTHYAPPVTYLALGNPTKMDKTRLATVILTYSVTGGSICAADQLANIFEFPKGIAAIASANSDIRTGSVIVRNASGAVVAVGASALALVRAKYYNLNMTVFLKGL